MTIYTGSRYEYSLIDYFSVKVGGNENPTIFYDFPDIGYLEYYSHIYKGGERLDQIAFKYYKRPGLWWLIVDHNPELNDPFDIKPGTILRIPNV